MQLDPPVFNGTDNKDAEDSLSVYERVSKHNRLDDAMKLKNVGVFLKGAAEFWYGNHQRYCRMGSEFQVKFVVVFGRPAVRKLQVVQCLSFRAQQAGENFTSYTEEFVDLCKHVGTSVAEAEKLNHILKA